MITQLNITIFLKSPQNILMDKVQSGLNLHQKSLDSLSILLMWFSLTSLESCIITKTFIFYIWNRFICIKLWVGPQGSVNCIVIYYMKLLQYLVLHFMTNDGIFRSFLVLQLQEKFLFLHHAFLLMISTQPILKQLLKGNLDNLSACRGTEFHPFYLTN